MTSPIFKTDNAPIESVQILWDADIGNTCTMVEGAIMEVAGGQISPTDGALIIAPVFTLYLRGVPRGDGKYLFEEKRAVALMRGFHAEIQDNSQTDEQEKNLSDLAERLAIVEPAMQARTTLVSGNLDTLYQTVTGSSKDSTTGPLAKDIKRNILNAAEGHPDTSAMYLLRAAAIIRHNSSNPAAIIAGIMSAAQDLNNKDPLPAVTAKRFMLNLHDLTLAVPDLQLILEPHFLGAALLSLAQSAGHRINAASLVESAFSLNYAWRPVVKAIRANQQVHAAPV